MGIMKQIFESPKTFTAYATIDAGYYMLSLLYEKLNKTQPRSKIIAMVDQATGYNPYKEIINEAIICMEDIIEAKKVIEADYSKDEETLKSLKDKL